jgi:hypothetical protein
MIVNIVLRKDIYHLLLGTGHLLLVTGHWVLVTRYWVLVLAGARRTAHGLNQMVTGRMKITKIPSTKSQIPNKFQ